MSSAADIDTDRFSPADVGDDPADSRQPAASSEDEPRSRIDPTLPDGVIVRGPTQRLRRIRR